MYTIRSSSLIFSFYKLDPEILGRVIEENEELQNIENLLREKLTNKIKHSTEQFNQTAEIALLQLFDEIQGMDGNDDGYITKHEFRILLNRLNIYFTKRRFDDAFGMIDTQVDGMITLTEFHAFIFPSDAMKVSYSLLFTIMILALIFLYRTVETTRESNDNDKSCWARKRW